LACIPHGWLADATCGTEAGVAVADDATAEIAAAEVEPAGVGTAWLEQAAAPRSATVAAPSAHPANLVRMTVMVQTLSQIKVRVADGGKSRTVAGCFVRVAHAS
jgi:hypothetical protein